MQYRRKKRNRRARRALPTALAVALGGGAALSGAIPSTADPAAAATAAPSPAWGNPYYLANSSGAVWPLGGAADHGSAAGYKLAAPIVGITVTPDQGGYWLVASDGGIFAFGDAGFYGSLGAVHLHKPVIGMAATPDGHGYWMYAADGGIFSFGDAAFYGSTGNVRLAKPVVGMAATPDGHGYYLYAADGGIFTFGDAHFHGSTGNVKLHAPVVAMAPTPDGGGYWLAGSDGGIFTFGDAGYQGSLTSARTTSFTLTKLVADPDGGGYWEVTHEGDVYPFGTAASYSIPTIGLMHTILGPGDVAMEWAMDQIGKPYQWGATGPSTFDCSGLTMRAWQAAGVTIPRVAADQYNFGTHLATGSDLRMGDLVYWATNPTQTSTIEHVALYIGGGHMVNAPHTGTNVRTDWIGGTGFVGVGTRP